MAVQWLAQSLARWTGRLHDCWFRLRLHFGKKIMYDSQRKIVQISRTQLAKGPCSEQELEAMQLISTYTSVSLPSIHRMRRLQNGEMFIVMEFVNGERLDHIWSGLSEDEQEEIAGRVWEELRKLRACPRPAHLDGLVVGTAMSGGATHDGALSLDAVGPFAHLQDFEELLRRSPGVAEFSHFWKDPDKIPSVSVLAHADLSPRNIIVRKSDKSICIIDWEFAGWWPSYWDVVKWHFSDFPTTPGWTAAMDKRWKLTGSDD